MKCNARFLIRRGMAWGSDYAKCSLEKGHKGNHKGKITADTSFPERVRYGLLSWENKNEKQKSC